MKRSVLLIIAALVCVSACVLLDNSNDIDADVTNQSGTCGTGVNYTFAADTGALTIDGSGAMENYSNSNSRILRNHFF